MRKIESDKTIKYISNEMLPKLGLRLNQVTYDIAFPDYTKNLRPDICISSVDYKEGNDVEFVSNLIAYIEVKDGFVVDNKDYKDALKQGVSSPSSSVNNIDTNR